MSRDSSDIDNALMATLGADSVLLSVMPNGVYWDEAPPNSTRFVIVSLAESHDEPQFGERSFEDVIYQVEAVALSTTMADMKAAARRIDELLDPQPPAPPAMFTIPGYQIMVTQRERRIRQTEVDEINPSIRWNHRGGHYRLVASPL
jgi:hypothetical protein